MTDPTRLLALAEECEKAAKPDRRLDCLLHVETIRTPDGTFTEVPPGPWKMTRWFYNPLPSVNWIGYDLLNVAPQYTASIDAALSLVPVRRMWFIGHMDPTDMRFAATISEIGRIGAKTWRGFHLSPALALCAAVLRVLAEEASDAP